MNDESCWYAAMISSGEVELELAPSPDADWLRVTRLVDDVVLIG